MKISEMTSATSLQNSDVLPIVRSSNNFKATLTTLASYVSDRISQLVGTSAITQLTANDATDDSRVHVTHSNTPRYITLGGITRYLFDRLIGVYFDCGTFNTEGSATGTVTFRHEFPNSDSIKPKVICTMHGTDSTKGIFTIKTSNVTSTGFSWAVVKMNDVYGDKNAAANGPNTVSFSVDYMAMYGSWS